MWSSLSRLQTMIWSAQFAKGSSGARCGPPATTSSARNASCSGWRGTERIFVNATVFSVEGLMIDTKSEINWADCYFSIGRQETCPCCRKHVNPSLIFIMFKLSKSIGCLKIKVGRRRDVLRNFCFATKIVNNPLSLPPDSVKTRSVAAKKPFASRSSTATAWRACTSSSHARTRGVGCSSSAGTWTITSATVSTGAGRATWAAGPCCPTTRRLSTTATSSWGWSTRPGRGTTGP